MWLGALGLALIFSVVPALYYTHAATQRPQAWGEGGAPWVVKLTALGCFALGQLWVPWVLLPMFYGVLILLFLLTGGVKTGIFFFLMGVGSIVQLVLSYQLLPLGIKLLCGEAGAARSARRLSRLALGSGALLLVLVKLGLLGTLPKLPPPLDKIIRYGMRLCLSLPTFYAVAGLLHGVLLRRSATLLQRSSR